MSARLAGEEDTEIKNTSTYVSVRNTCGHWRPDTVFCFPPGFNDPGVSELTGPQFAGFVPVVPCCGFFVALPTDAHELHFQSCGEYFPLVVEMFSPSQV